MGVRIYRACPLLFSSIAPVALLYSQDAQAVFVRFTGAESDEKSNLPAAFIHEDPDKKMSEPKPLEEDLKLVKYRSSYWIVLEPEGIPLMEFAAQHHDTLGEPLYQWMKTRLSRASILEFHESGKFDWGNFRDFMKSKGWDISRNEPGIINA